MLTDGGDSNFSSDLYRPDIALHLKDDSFDILPALSKMNERSPKRSLFRPVRSNNKRIESLQQLSICDCR